jgi:hypothetical protein
MAEITELELPQNQKSFWLKAKGAVEMKNHGYAVSLIQAILKDHPGFLVGREMMRNCESVITGGPKKKQKIFGMETSSGPGMKILSTAKKDPAGAVLLIEKELEKDPYNIALNEVRHVCFIAMELFDSEAFALETLRIGLPDNTKSMH